MSHETYQGEIIRWVDGDTVEIQGWREIVLLDTSVFGVEIRLTFMARKRDTYRLTIVDTPENGEPGYREATAYCNQVLPAGTRVEFITHGVDNGGWGRTLADVLIPGQGTTTMSSLLLQTGHAVVWTPR